MKRPLFWSRHGWSIWVPENNDSLPAHPTSPRKRPPSTILKRRPVGLARAASTPPKSPAQESSSGHDRPTAPWDIPNHVGSAAKRERPANQRWLPPHSTRGLQERASAMPARQPRPKLSGRMVPERRSGAGARIGNIGSRAHRRGHWRAARLTDCAPRHGEHLPGCRPNPETLPRRPL